MNSIICVHVKLSQCEKMVLWL